MADWFRGGAGAEKWLRKRWSGGRTDDAKGAPSGRVVNAVGGGFHELGAGEAKGAWRGACYVLRMWLRGRWVKVSLVAAGLLSTGCAGAIGVGAAAVFVGAGVLGFTCYDRVSVVVTDRVTGTKLCDAKVSFFEGKSETVATSCYQAALSAGKYRMHVERRGLAPFDEPIEVTEGSSCGQSVQTMYVALDRLNRATTPEQVAPPAPVPAATVGTVVTPPAAQPATTPPATPSTTPPVAPAPAAPKPAAPKPAAAPPAAPAPTPAPATSAFPDTP